VRTTGAAGAEVETKTKRISLCGDAFQNAWEDAVVAVDVAAGAMMMTITGDAAVGAVVDAEVDAVVDAEVDAVVAAEE